MTDNQTIDVDIINFIIGIAALVIPTIFFLITAPENVRILALITFGAIVVTIIIASMAYLTHNKNRRVSEDVEDNKSEIVQIKKSLNIDRLFRDMDVRLKVAEKLLDKLPRNKKGIAIDPRIIWAIILLILLLIFLRFSFFA